MNANDLDAIERLIRSQLDAMRWESGGDGDWKSFQSGFMPDAQLYAATRPARPQSVSDFVSRMRTLAADGTLRTFSETPLGMRIMIFGNVAVALAGCEMLENGQTITRNASAFLLIKDGAEWRVAGQAWDLESAGNALPPDLAAQVSQMKMT